MAGRQDRFCTRVTPIVNRSHIILISEKDHNPYRIRNLKIFYGHYTVRKDPRQMTEDPKTLRESSSFTIRPFRETDVAYVIAGQLALYAAEYGFTSHVWNDYLKGGVQDFVRQFDCARDCMYISEQDEAPCGCIAITHTDEGAAQLRFFFMEKECRGMGAGRRLIDCAIGFCRDVQYERVFLWTFRTLDAARHLYEDKGFRIIDTHINNEWGGPILEEKWELDL